MKEGDFVSYLFKHSLWIALFASIGTLGTVFVAEYGFLLKPCVLCVYQRWPYAAVIAIVILALIFRNSLSRIYFQGAAAIAFAVTSGVGAYHVGVEKGWWLGSAECSADTSASLSLQDLRAQIMSAPLVKCNEVAWELFGISMAGYNFLFAAVMVIFMIAAMWQNLTEAK